ncbi:MAG: thioredoxin family protein [Burkholderiales bacterium]|nr:thioredoxin family protein [Burkholderiales bacterium]
MRTPHAEAELLAGRTAIEPGRPLTLALRLKADPGWHTYWRNPGDSGEPTRLEWKLPPGYAAGPMLWPHPERLPAGPLMNYGYEGEVLLLSDITVPRNAGTGPVTLAAHATWLVCNPERCIPEEAQLSVTLPAGPAADTPWTAAIKRTRAALPVRAAEHGSWRFSARRGDGGRVELNIAPPLGIAPKDFAFYPYEEGKVEYAGAQTLIRDGDHLRLLIPPSTQLVGEWMRVAGILVTDEAIGANGLRAIEIDVPISAAAAAGPLGLAAALMLAFVGGMILNLMPCVLPVLSIKVLGFTQPGNHRAHGLVYAAGVLISFWLLAGLLIALKTAGAELGWGFQLQSPLFVALLALLFFALALNLSGVFEFGSMLPASFAGARSANRSLDAFLTGVLAVVVASPCTAPFMGAALGYALTQNAPSTLLVFTALGIGMALPYVALAWHPRWLARLPRPGAWMLRLKQFLAFPLYGTVVWLAWVLGRQAGLDAVILLLAALVVLGGAAWLAGVPSRRPVPVRAAATVLAALAIGLVLPAARDANPVEQARADETWESWSKDRVTALVAQGKPVFVDFTAAWCVTCQVNKQLVLTRPDVEQAFRERGVTLVRADWTRRDADIAAALAELGRNGVPVYVLYLPGREPQLLPEILTRDVLFAALADISI